jgi:superfamily II DNA or RNA helicase
MQLREYQEQCVGQVFESWKDYQKSLIVIPTGGGKTIVFAHIANRANGRTLILAHREELLQQAKDKIKMAVGRDAALERADDFADPDYRIVVGSVQTLLRRHSRFPQDYFTNIIVDEAHHVAADSYQTVLGHFPKANILGVTATPDRSDKKQLGSFFENVAYEITLLDLIKQGYLVPIKARVCDVSIDLTNVKFQAGDFDAGDTAHAIEPYLERIAGQIKQFGGKKTIVFLPLIATSEKMTDICRSIGLDAEHVDGTSHDRSEILKRFSNKQHGVLCNAMLLTEGYDEPSIDTIVCLRPTRSRSLYTQMIGRGTRLHPGKTHLTILDFLWMTGRHKLVRPTRLISQDEIADIADEMISTQGEFDLQDVVGDAVTQRENTLARQLAEKKKLSGKVIDPLEFALSIHDTTMADWQPTMPWHHDRMSEAQERTLKSFGFDTESITSKGQASAILDRVMDRSKLKLATPKQVKWLTRFGIKNAYQWKFEAASKFLDTKFKRQ